jgi:hypothetical protein
MPVAFALQMAFSIWMLMHAIRRGAPQYWYLIVLLPFGEWAYFLLIFLPDQGGSLWFKKIFTRPPSLEDLERSHRQTPSQTNLLHYAQGLFLAGKYAESNEHFAEVLADNSEDKDAIYGYARTCLELGDEAAGMRALEQLLALDIDYRDHKAAFRLAELYWRREDQDKCVEFLQRVCARTQRIQPRVQLARYLQELARYTEARQLLEEGIDSYKGSPAHARRRQRVSAWEAKRMLRQLPS